MDITSGRKEGNRTGSGDGNRSDQVRGDWRKQVLGEIADSSNLGN